MIFVINNLKYDTDKMEIVEFCEKVLNIRLLDFQKKLLRDMYEAGKNNQQFIFMPSLFALKKLGYGEIISVMKKGE